MCMCVSTRMRIYLYLYVCVYADMSCSLTFHYRVVSFDLYLSPPAAGVPVLGVVENMADIALPLSLLTQEGGGVKLITKQVCTILSDDDDDDSE